MLDSFENEIKSENQCGIWEPPFFNGNEAIYKQHIISLKYTYFRTH